MKVLIGTTKARTWTILATVAPIVIATIAIAIS